MNILYIGDVMADVGLKVVEKVLPDLKKKYMLDLIVAQAENVSEGKGTTVADFIKLKRLGIDFCSGGNWSLFRPEIYPYFDNPDEPINRPANYPNGTPGKKYKIIYKDGQKILFVSLLGHIVGKESDKPLENPLIEIDKILEETKSQSINSIIVNFHGDFSSEKVIIGHYLDGRVTAAIGDHWHVPTNDARILPKGTAHISDVGMCGPLNSSLGISFESVIPRWYEGKMTRNVVEHKGPKQFNAVLINKKANHIIADTIKQIQINLS